MDVNKLIKDGKLIHLNKILKDTLPFPKLRFYLHTLDSPNVLREIRILLTFTIFRNCGPGQGLPYYNGFFVSYNIAVYKINPNVYMKGWKKLFTGGCCKVTL